MSNLKQMGLAVMMYVQDYDEMYPPASNPSPGIADADYPGGKWGAGAGVNSLYWPQLIYPYSKSIQLFYCPSGAKYSKPTLGQYGANGNVLLAAGSTPLKLASINMPTSTYLAMDSGNWFIYASATTNDVVRPRGYNSYIPGIGDSLERTCSAPSTASTVAIDSPACQDFSSGRHLGGVNVIFADGHVKWLKTNIVYSEAARSDRGAWNPSNS